MQLARFAIVPTQKHPLSVTLSVSRSVSRPIPLPPRQQAHTVGYTRSAAVFSNRTLLHQTEEDAVARVAPRFPPCCRAAEGFSAQQRAARIFSPLPPSVAADTTGKLSSRALSSRNNAGEQGASLAFLGASCRAADTAGTVVA